MATVIEPAPRQFRFARLELSRRGYANGLIALCTAAVLAYALVILGVFGHALANGEWEHLFGFTRIVIPDTLLYLQIAQARSVTEFLLLAAVKNSIAPSLVWFLLYKNWYLVTLFNALCFSLVLVYTRRILLLLDPEQRRKFPSIAVVLTIACSYYAVGSLKEIPTLLGLTAFVYCFLTQQRARAVLWFAFLLAFRFQFAYLVLGAYLATKLRRNPFRMTLLTLAVIGAIFPLVSLLQVFTPGALSNLRLAAAGNSVGSLVEYVRSHMLGLSLIAILIRIGQSILEPLVLLVRTRSFYEAGSLSLFHVHSMLILVVTFAAWMRACFGRFYRMASVRGRETDFGILYSFLAIATFAIGGTGLISQRFLFPVLALLLIVARVSPQPSDTAAVAVSDAAPSPG